MTIVFSFYLCSIVSLKCIIVTNRFYLYYPSALRAENVRSEENTTIARLVQGELTIAQRTQIRN